MPILSPSPSARQSQPIRRTIRLSVERPSGKRRSVCVTVERAPADDDRSLMVKASAEYRRVHGYADRVVAIYVTN